MRVGGQHWRPPQNGLGWAGSRGGHGSPTSPSLTFFFQEPRTPGTASWSRLMASLWREELSLEGRGLKRAKSSKKGGGSEGNNGLRKGFSRP